MKGCNLGLDVDGPIAPLNARCRQKITPPVSSLTAAPFNSK